MKQQQFKNLLRNAVIAALPLASQVGCATTEADSEPPKTNDPCRTGETTRKSAQTQFSAQVKLMPEPLSAEQCIALCKQKFESNRVGGFTDLVKLESIEASNCTTENRPYSTMIPGGRYPTPSTLVSCDVEYTALHSPYTCPKPVPGRAPHGLHVKGLEGNQAVDSSKSIIGQYLADMTVMETAAITAFDYLRRELEAYDAPAELIARAGDASIEETRHAEMAGLLSAAYDAEVSEVRVDDFVLRSLYEIALENAVEGCVNETFAAACGLWQSEHAQLDVFRQVMGHITDEEMGHAALSWDIHEWIMPQLSMVQQEQIRAAQAEAIGKLVDDFKQESNPELRHAFGLPGREDAKRLFTQLQNSVWQAVKVLQSDFGAQQALS